TGGTGVSPRDFTPEATQSVLDRVVPGIAEALRADAIRKTPHGLLGRGTAGIRGQALIVNLPGSPGGCRDGFALIKPALPHAIELIAGGRSEHRPTGAPRSRFLDPSRRSSRSSTRCSRCPSRTSVHCSA